MTTATNPPQEELGGHACRICRGKPVPVDTNTGAQYLECPAVSPTRDSRALSRNMAGLYGQLGAMIVVVGQDQDDPDALVDLADKLADLVEVLHERAWVRQHDGQLD